MKTVRSDRDLMTAEYYSPTEPDRLLAAAYVPRKTAADSARIIGRAVCVALGTDAVNAVLLDSAGGTVEVLLVSRKR